MVNINNITLTVSDKKRVKEAIGGLPIIVVAGPMGAGKEIAGKALQEAYGYGHFLISDILRRQLILRGKIPPFSRQQLGNLAEELHFKYGKQILAQVQLEEIVNLHSESPLSGAVIEGNRYVEETRFFKQFSNVGLVWIDAPQEVRYARLIQRGRLGDILVQDEFKRRDKFEASWMKGIRELSEISIANEGSIQELKRTIINFAEHRFTANS